QRVMGSLLQHLWPRRKLPAGRQCCNIKAIHKKGSSSGWQEVSLQVLKITHFGANYGNKKSAVRRIQIILS
ncbi:hypothetical protein VF13_40115, partial [Nostoc linckia z16]